MTAEVMPEQLLNAPLSMLVTLSGMMTEARDVQPEKVKLYIVFILSGMLTETKRIQPANAESPSRARCSGRMTEVRFSQLRKAPERIFSRLSGRTSSRRPEQSLKVSRSMTETDFGNMTDVRLLQDANACFSISLSCSVNSKEARETQL